MTALKKAGSDRKMTVSEFLDWTEGQPGRFELSRGYVVAMTPPTIAHSRIKFAACAALRAAIKRAGKPCEALVDGPGVVYRDESFYIPDVVVYCGERIPGRDNIVPDPLIVVEVTSPSTAWLDKSAKLADYFGLPSLAHYLIIDPDGNFVVHHQREDQTVIRTAILRGGEIALDPPGIAIAVPALFESE
jgi:Uma2 family endonuclease